MTTSPSTTDLRGPRPEPAPPGLAVDVVVPTMGRPSLGSLLDSLAAAHGPPPASVVLVDDRPDPDPPLLDGPPPPALADRLRIVRGRGRGPAAARNVGWRTGSAPWVAFLDDDVLLPGDWLARLREDLERAPADVGACQGTIEVPLPDDRAPTDWERNVAGLEDAAWATADMAYRRAALEAVGGFDERFPRAFREDADLGLRTVGAGYRIVRGRRHIVHPVRPADDWVSVRLQAGNADDPLMVALHGRDWWQRAGAPVGRRPWHLATVAAGATGLGAALGGHRRTAALAGLAWAGLTADFARRRIAPGPRTPREILRMGATSVAIPVAATWHWLRGLATLPRRLARPGPGPGGQRP